MKLDILVVTNCKDLSQTVGRRGKSLIDPKLLEKVELTGISVNVAAFRKDCVRSEELINFILDGYSSNRACILVVDSRVGELAPSLCPSVLCVRLDVFGPRPNYGNTLRKSLNLALKAVERIKPFFASRDYVRHLLLPTQNFSADEWLDFVNSLRCGTTGLGFVEQLQTVLKRLRDRQRPKTSTGYQNVFVVDDLSRFFTLGYEKHSSAETSCPPHSTSCVLAARYRFGFPLEPTQHYNVSNEGQLIGGVFVNCHGESSVEPTTSHFNVFPNDFYKK